MLQIILMVTLNVDTTTNHCTIWYNVELLPCNYYWLNGKWHSTSDCTCLAVMTKHLVCWRHVFTGKNVWLIQVSVPTTMSAISISHRAWKLGIFSQTPCKFNLQSLSGLLLLRCLDNIALFWAFPTFQTIEVHSGPLDDAVSMQRSWWCYHKVSQLMTKKLCLP